MNSGELELIWPQVRRLFARSDVTVITSVNQDGSPHVTPIGSIFLRRDCSGYYLERFPTGLPRNVEHNPRIAVYAAEGGKFFWMQSLVRGRFVRLPAIRLLGRAGERRFITDEEQARFLRKVRFFRWTKGYDLLWSDFKYVRELVFDGYEPVLAGRMTH